ncbi:hypothetical protein Poli38472_008620 [Pythium oligandrum]|uniref:Mitotic-spindle organizing protein 1 n=1 Tax=Pythium oligandrum TaxID=41045 RepID=A0A8K1C3U8_PYTOL|nr:hypothetical protein Poli38472_008620 [Pythium oligandrum]|eukprot:TMW55972.1 hypothetical protein Poli38472_008620 [Pythium oligandrum]
MADSVQTLESIYELSRLLNTGLDRETLAILIQLIQQGVNPEALAGVVRDLRKEAAAQRQQEAEQSAASAAAFSQHQQQRQQMHPEPLKKRRNDY